MSLRLLSISSLYSGYLSSFYSMNANIRTKSYKEHLSLILEDSVDFGASYVKTFNKLGLLAECIIANDKHLQNKWYKENCKGIAKKKDLLFHQVASFMPDILWIEDLRFVDKDWIENVRHTIGSIRVIIANFSAPYNSRVIEKLRAMDFVIACTPGLKSEFEGNGIRTYLVYHGFDTDLLEKIKVSNDLVHEGIVFTGSLFAGAGYHNSRIELLDSILCSGINISLYLNLEKNYKIFAKNFLHFINELIRKTGFEKTKKYFSILEYGNSHAKKCPLSLVRANKGPIYGLDMYSLLAGSKIVLNSHGEVAGNYAGNMRLFETTGLGSCLLTDAKSNLKDLFDTEKEIVIYKNPQDCIEKIKWLLNHEEERSRIAEAGHQKTLTIHTVYARCKQIESIITKEFSDSKH
ncbi:MAG: glycosyltransferase [Bacteroidia bacterium]|nr:glycosyltransferase [Bacteroidia bacterium]